MIIREKGFKSFVYYIKRFTKNEEQARELYKTFIENKDKQVFKLYLQEQDLRVLKKEYLAFKNDVQEFKLTFYRLGDFLNKLSIYPTSKYYYDVKHNNNTNRPFNNPILNQTLVLCEKVTREKKHNYLLVNKPCKNFIIKCLKINNTSWYKPKKDKLLQSVKKSKYTLSDKSYMLSITINHSDLSSLENKTTLEDFLKYDIEDKLKYKDYTTKANYIKNNIHYKYFVGTKTFGNIFKNDLNKIFKDITSNKDLKIVSRLYLSYYLMYRQVLLNKLFIARDVKREIKREPIKNHIIKNTIKNNKHFLLSLQNKEIIKEKEIKNKARLFNLIEKVYNQEKEILKREIRQKRQKEIKARKQKQRKQYLRNNSFIF